MVHYTEVFTFDVDEASTQQSQWLFNALSQINATDEGNALLEILGEDSGITVIVNTDGDLGYSTLTSNCLSPV